MSPASRWLAWLATLPLLAAGCAVVPRGRLDDARSRIQSLQAENQELRNATVRLGHENQDMALRAVEDSRRLGEQDKAIRGLERSLADYQDEREQMAARLDAIQNQIREAAREIPTRAALPPREGGLIRTGAAASPPEVEPVAPAPDGGSGP